MVAGSILPITIHNNKLYFLFGKENPMEDSAKGWSDFGGRVDAGETPFTAALREGGEELTGFLGNNNKEIVEIENGFIQSLNKEQ
jgi:predicted NUDIX family NTP pyrophosphohydrolase